MDTLTLGVIGTLEESLHEGGFTPIFDMRIPAAAYGVVELIEPIATSILKLARTENRGLEFKALSNGERHTSKLFHLIGDWRTSALSLRNPDLGLDFAYDHDAHLFGAGGMFRLEYIQVVMAEPAVRNQVVLLFDRKPTHPGGIAYDWDDGFVELALDRYGRARFRGYGVEHCRLIDSRSGFGNEMPAYADVDSEHVFDIPQNRDQIIGLLPQFAAHIGRVADFFEQLDGRDV